MSEMTVHLKDFVLPKSLFDVLNAVAYERGKTLDFVGFLEEALREWTDGRALGLEDRERAREVLREAFVEHRSNLIDISATPVGERTPIYAALLTSERSWFHLNQRCPECGGPVDQNRKDKLLCSRRCNKRFYLRIWKRRNTREEKIRQKWEKKP